MQLVAALCNLWVDRWFYDWYADLPPASPQIWGDQTDVPESSDWYNLDIL